MKSKDTWLSLGYTVPRLCLRDAIPEIFIAAKYLNEAVSAHFANKPQLAAELIALANKPEIRKVIGEWADSLRGKYNFYNRPISEVSPKLNKEQRPKLRMPSTEDKLYLLRRDGFHCRFCGIPVLRKEVRKSLISLYPGAIPWGLPNSENHAALYAMDAQYDHLLPHSRGGSSDLDNLVITCNPCNYGRGEHTLEEMGLADPRTREPIHTAWDGLERLLDHSKQK
jgi:5-methylcytosine-specific restriction endonuclease McrA